MSFNDFICMRYVDTNISFSMLSMCHQIEVLNTVDNLDTGAAIRTQEFCKKHNLVKSTDIRCSAFR